VQEEMISKRKLLLFFSIAVNLGILAVFKYFNFFIDSMISLLSLFSINGNPSVLKIVLPVGISFYTFQTLGYTIDVFNRKIDPAKNILSFFAFVSFFPQLVAGPIERASRMLPQFLERKKFMYEHCITGLRLVLWGLFTKIVLADNLGVLSDSLFNVTNPISGLTTLLGVFCFAFQIYADFSGYSNIAIGLAKMLGYDLMTNFRTPYFSSSFGEFWHRWHISLSTWFRDYVYIPMGGNQGGSFKVSFNIFITFLLSGLWHGAQISFLIWGALHGIALIVEKRVYINFYKWIRGPFVFLIVVLLWIPFRAENVNHLMTLTKSLFDFQAYTFSNIHQIITDFSPFRFTLIFLIFIIFMRLEWSMKEKDFSSWISAKSRFTRISMYYFLITLILLAGNFSVKPNFIYFQF
jgi:D-alanyl-lipoteichoic acid acyltransferase DltB (MBOAT superfamily)